MVGDTGFVAAPTALACRGSLLPGCRSHARWPLKKKGLACAYWSLGCPPMSRPVEKVTDETYSVLCVSRAAREPKLKFDQLIIQLRR